MSKEKKLKHGIVDFKQLIESNSYYVDKTLFIKEFIGQKRPKGTKLILRPKRFGKTLMQSTLSYFLDIDLKEEAKGLFDGLEISKYPEIIEKHMNKYPVISLSFKDIKTFDGDDYLNGFRKKLASEYERHSYVKEIITNEAYFDIFERIQYMKADSSDYGEYLSLLAMLLHQYHKVRPIILLDDYDVPLQYAYMECEECRKDIMQLIESIIGSGLSRAEGSLTTSCLHITNYIMYSSLEDFNVFSLDNLNYNEYFGFTHEEVEKVLSDFDLSSRIDEVKKHYGGYNFGGIEMYNPCSVIKFVERCRNAQDIESMNYMSNASSNKIFRTILESCYTTNEDLKYDFEILINEEEVAFNFDKTVVCSTMLERQSAIIGTLLYTGYLTEAKAPIRDGIEVNKYRNPFAKALKIPNEEVRTEFIDLIKELNAPILEDRLGDLFNALVKNDVEGITKELSYLTNNTISARIKKIKY